MKKRLLSLVLVFSFIFGTLPVNVLAGTTQTEKREAITGNGKVKVEYLDETGNDLTTLSPSVKIDKEKYPTIAEGKAGEEISKNHLDTKTAPKFIGYKIESVKTYPVPAQGEKATYTTESKYTVKFIYKKIDDIKGPLNLIADDFPEGYIAVKFFAVDSENDIGEFDGNTKAVVYAVNPINTTVDTTEKKLKGKKADGGELNVDFPTYNVKEASKGTWKTNDKAPWKMEPDGAIKEDKKINVQKLGKKQELTFIARYVKEKGKVNYVYEYKNKETITDSDKTDIPALPTDDTEYEFETKVKPETTVAKDKIVPAKDNSGKVIGSWKFSGWDPAELEIKNHKNRFTGIWTFTESIASILKDKLSPQDIKVWKNDKIDWKKGVKLKEGTVDTNGKLKDFLDKATVTDKSNRNSKTANSNPFNGTIKVTFSDGSELLVENQNLYVSEHMTGKDNKNAPNDALEVTFKLGEGVKAGVTTGEAIPKEYERYKVKPNTNLDTYKLNIVGTEATIFQNIKAEVTDKTKYSRVVWEGQTPNKPEDHVVTASNNVFTAKATKIFTVTHEFVSGTKDKALPTTGMPDAPKAVTGKELGSTVKAPTTTYNDVKVAEGTWKFKGWNPETLTVSATEKNNKFMGKWEFTPDKKTVNLTFEFYKKKDSGNTLQPDNALGGFKKPNLENLAGQEVGAEITLPTFDDIVVNTGDLQGTWKFDGWYKDKNKVIGKLIVSANDAENKLVGKWILTETETATVTRNFVIDPTIMGDGKDVPTGHKLPDAVKVAQKVNDTTNYIGSTQTPGKDNFEAVPETINSKQGTWTFKEWTPKTLTVNKDESKNVFKGTWTWTEKGKVNVEYVFKTKDTTRELPEEITKLKPDDLTGDKAVYLDKAPAAPTGPDTKSFDVVEKGQKIGTWTTDGKWTKEELKGKVIYTLTWTFKEARKDKPKPSTPTKPTTPSKPTKPSTPSTPDRVNGKNRVDTAIEISKKYFGQAERVIIVDASNFPDAMAASALAKQLKAPILLTNSNNLDSRVAAEIKRLGAHNVTVIGGKSSVSDGALNQLSKFDKDGVERISGKDRYETSAEVARRLAKITGKTGHAVIASGEVFADALAVGPYAAREGYPILLVKSNSIPKSISDVITEIGVKKVSIVGGYGSVSKSLEKSLPVVAERLSGKTRYETAIEIASKGLKTSNKVFVANGEQWMDALVIGPVGGMLDMPILLTGANSAPQSLRDHIAKSNIEKITAIGGTSMVSGKVLNELSK